MPSRIAKNPIAVPVGVDIKVAGCNMIVKGKLGELTQVIPDAVRVEQRDKHLLIIAATDSPEANTLSGTIRALLQNLISGVSEGFEKKLLLVGVGYRAKAQGNTLDLTVGLSHPKVIKMPIGVAVETPSNTEIVLKGADKQLVSQVAANIRSVRPPEPYKGKGIRYADEQISLKEGKKK